MFLKKTLLFSLMLASLGFIPLTAEKANAAENSDNISSELAWWGRHYGYRGGYGWGGYGYYRPYYYHYPYYYQPYYYYPYYYRYWA